MGGSCERLVLVTGSGGPGPTEGLSVSDKYVGRHRRNAPVGRGPAARRAAALRPVAHAGATVALAGAAVGGYLVSAPDVAQHGAVRDNVALPATETAPPTDALLSVALTKPTGSGPVERASTQLAADKLDSRRTVVAYAAAQSGAAAAAAAEAARLEAERQAAADRAARDAARASVLANAQANPKAAAQALVAQHGWNDAQFQCLVKLWTKESNWNFRATNRSSGAYGIPQALPGSKMATVAADWRTNPVTQITWGLGYIKGRYGSPCSAWAAWQSRSPHWY